MRKTFLIITVFAVSFMLFYTPARAVAGFSTSIESNYYIDQTGVANVTQTTHLTNDVANVYATEYELSIGSNRVRNIIALNDEGQKIPFTTEVTENSTLVNLSFNKKVVGKGKTRTFVVTYQNPDVAQKEGNILEVSIPKLSNPSEIDDYSVLIRVPTFFGHPTLLNPQADKVETVANTTNVTFDREEVKSDGVIAIFGEQQVYNFSLNYHLENDNITPIATQIALPPDTPFQKMIYHQIDPKPRQINRDKNGNWIATYELEAKEKLTITASASAAISITPIHDLPSTADDMKDFLSADNFWPTEDPQIKKLAADHDTAREIYDYLVNNFNYNYSRIDNQSTQRLGAKTAIEQPNNALCLEFTDAFVAIARSAGIPSRAVLGYAHTQNQQLRPLSLIQDVLHAWPEYYDSKENRWIPIDPTWANTTGGIDYFSHLDFNHVTFAIQGTSSNQPYPVGYYKFEGVQSKDVHVSLAENTPLIEPKVSLEVKKNPITTINSQKKTEVIMTNSGNSALYNQPLVLRSGGEVIAEKNIPSLLPFQTLTIPVEFAPDKIAQDNTVTYTYHDQKITQTISRGSFNPRWLIAATAFVAAAITLIATKPWSLLVSK